MKIAVAAPTHLPARRANTLQVMKMTQALAGLGHEVSLAVPGAPPAPVGWDDLANQYGLGQPFEVTWLPVMPRLRSYDYGMRAVNWARRQKADLFYTRLPQAAALAAASGLSTILEVHDLPAGVMGAWLFRRFLMGRGARRLVVITHSLADDLTARFGAPRQLPFTLVAPDGVDLERFENLPAPDEARLALPLKLQGFTAGYTGHLYPGRGIRLILDMAAALPQVNFLLVGGEAEDVERLRGTVKDRRLDNVHLAGYRPNTEIPLWQAACEVLLMPYQEHVAASSGGDIGRYLSPMKLFEYLACGRAILSSNLPVLGEVLNHDNAALLPPDDLQAWIKAIQDMRDDPARRDALGRRARRDAAGYSWKSRAAAVLAGLERWTGV